MVLFMLENCSTIAYFVWFPILILERNASVHFFCYPNPVYMSGKHWLIICNKQQHFECSLVLAVFVIIRDCQGQYFPSVWIDLGCQSIDGTKRNTFCFWACVMCTHFWISNPSGLCARHSIDLHLVHFFFFYFCVCWSQGLTV